MLKKITLGLLVFISFYLLLPFLSALGMGAIFAVLFYPWMKRIDRGRFPNSLAAGLFMLAVTLIIFLPVISMSIVGVKAGLHELKQFKGTNQASGEVALNYEMLDHLFESSGIPSLLQGISRVFPFDPAQISTLLKDFIMSILAKVGDALSHFIASIPSTMLAFTVFLFSMYYFLADGGQFLRVFRQRSFFSDEQTNQIFAAFSGLCRSVILASVVTGGVQALLATIATLAVGIRQPVMVFGTTFVASFIPLIGSFPVLLTLSLYQLFTGHPVQAIVLIASAVVIGSVDNFIRPQIIHGGSNLHPLISFVAALGGLELFGMSGLFLGPIILGMTLEIVRILQNESAA